VIPGSLGPNCEPSLGRWMSKLWNAVIAPRVQEAILSRASVKRQPGLGQTTKNPSQGQQAVVRAALSILLNKAVLHGCPLQRAGMWVYAGRRGNSLLCNACLNWLLGNSIFSLCNQ